MFIFVINEVKNHIKEEIRVLATMQKFQYYARFMADKGVNLVVTQ